MAHVSSKLEPSSARVVTIEKLVHGGFGLARDGSQVLFVRGALSGETVAVATKTDGPRGGHATVQEVIQASPHRVVPPCPVYEPCGGCQLQHLSYEMQLREKAA